MTRLVSAERIEDGAAILLVWSDGLQERLPALWALEAARLGRDPASGHRLGPLPDPDDGERVVTVAWDGERLTVRLAAHASVQIPGDRLVQRRDDGGGRVLWRRPEAVAEIGSAPLFMSDDGALRRALFKVETLGVAVLEGGPAEPGFLESVTARFGHVRETNYGRLFDVRSEAVPSHLAYSPVGLALHTDNPYRDPVPSLQLLHGIRAAPEGGRTLFADGFAAAETLRAVEPAHFERLAVTGVDFTYRAPDGALYRARRPVLTLDPDGRLETIAFNARAVDFHALKAETVASWLAAWRAFEALVSAPEAHLDLLIAPGVVVIFDNRRILHGRSPIGGAGERWLQGCYADMDGLKATRSRLDGR